MRPIVIVFARAPHPGTVKTRLTVTLSPECAMALHVAMVTDLTNRLQQLRPTVDLELHTNEPTSAFQFTELTIRIQARGDLGHRLYASIAEALDAGRPAVLILGSDSPTVPLAHFSAMLATDADVTLGPASDGGFYAILCRRAHPEMFAGVAWSSPASCAETANGVRRCGLTLATGPEWYDIDTPADLCKLAHDPNLGSATRDVLAAAGHLPS